MYNIIFSLIDIRGTLTVEQSQEFRNNFDYVGFLPESRKVDDRILYQGNVKSLDELVYIKAQLDLLDTPDIIGLWVNKGKNNGLQQGYKYKDNGTLEIPDIVIVRNTIVDENDNEIDEPIIYPFNINEYLKYLKDIEFNIVYDENAVKISSEFRRPTIDEARNTNVNYFGGMKKRYLA